MDILVSKVVTSVALCSCLDKKLMWVSSQEILQFVKASFSIILKLESIDAHICVGSQKISYLVFKGDYTKLIICQGRHNMLSCK